MDLNCVYCHARCVCVHVCVLIWVCLHSCICFPQSLTLLSILHFDHMPQIILHSTFLINVMKLSVTYSRYNSFFLVLWGGEVYYNSTVLHKHIHTCATYTHNHRVFWLYSGEAKLLCDWGELWYCHQSINQPLPTPGQARESNANMALPHTHWSVRVYVGSKGDQITARAERAMTLNVWLRQEST